MFDVVIEFSDTLDLSLLAVGVLVKYLRYYCIRDARSGSPADEARVAIRPSIPKRPPTLLGHSWCAL